MCVRMTTQQPFGRGIIISVDLIRSRLNVDRHELAIIPRPQVGTDITLLDSLSLSGKLFFAIVWFQHGHDLTPTSTCRTAVRYIFLGDCLVYCPTFKIATFV